MIFVHQKGIDNSGAHTVLVSRFTKGPMKQGSNARKPTSCNAGLELMKMIVARLRTLNILGSRTSTGN